MRTAPAPIALLACLLAGGAVIAEPTPTPTPRAKLSGGFGRTPIAGPENGGQTMADVVRAAGEARARKAQKKPLAITNRNLVTDPTKGRLSTAAAAPGAPTGAPRGTPTPRTTPPAAASTPAKSKPEAGVPTEESSWRERARAARQRVEDARSRIAQLESETRKLEADFYSWDDGQYRDGVIKPAWDRKREELEAARHELADAEKDLADLPEQARRAGALPGWLRE